MTRKISIFLKNVILREQTLSIILILIKSHHQTIPYRVPQVEDKGRVGTPGT